jgi:regulatory protein
MDLNISKIQAKLEAYCAYQDRSTKEVQKKMESFSLSNKDREALLSHLRNMKFLDDERFTESFVQGKFRIKKWGKIKIKSHLIQHHIPSSLISEAMTAIRDKDYFATIEQLIEKKKALLNSDLNDYQIKEKIIRYLQSKGYELNVIFDCLD